MPDGKVEIELRVTTAKLAGDLKDAKAKFKKEADEASRPMASRDWMAEGRAAAQRNIAATKAAQAAGGYPAAPPYQFVPPVPIGLPRTKRPPLLPLPGVQQYGAPIGPQQNSIAAMWSKLVNFNMTPLGATIVKVAAAVAAARVAFGLVGWAARLALTPLTRLASAIASLFTQAAEAARSLYARTLQGGGLPLGFTARRSVLASVIGVGEHEVMQYGKAVGYLNAQLRFASQVAASTNLELTSAAWAMRTVRGDFKALSALFANELAPLVRQLAGAFHLVAVMLQNEARFWGMAIAAGIKAGIASVPIVGPAFLAAMALMDKGKAPEPTVSTGRLQGSAWEKMGLVIGAGTGNNWQQQTARATLALLEIQRTALGLLHAMAGYNSTGVTNAQNP